MRRSAATLLVLAAAALTFAGPPRGPAAADPVAPDLLYFAQKIATDLHARCSGCHSDAESAAMGGFLLKPLDDVANPDRALLLANYRTVLRFLDPDEPLESPILRRVLGGDGHNPFYKPTDRDYQELLHFAMGATLDNVPPEAIASRRHEAGVGEPKEIDGTLSGDPDDDPITYHWKVAERPAGSRVKIDAAEKGRARLTPDRPGVYRVELSVHDGKLWSLPASMLVVASASGKRAAGTPPRGDTGMGSKPAPKPLMERRLKPERLKLIRRLYVDLKWRTPHLDEIESWYEVSHEEMVKEFLKDEETWEGWYEQQLYYFLLLDQFRPKEGRLTTIPARLASGELDAPMALQEIVRSQYFGARNPGNDTFVTVVLEQCLGLVVQERPNLRTLELGKKMYDGYKVKLFKERGDSQADFVRIVFRQKDFFRHLLARTWKQLHGTDIDKKRLDKYAPLFDFDKQAYRKILYQWLTGPEYTRHLDTARTKNEIPYARSLFLDILGRLPVYNEMRNVRNAFLSLADPTPIRLVIGRVLLESPEARIPASVIRPERFVKEQFVRLFARQPTARELDAFVNGLKNDPQVTARVVLWTLISSAEYQTY